MSIHYTLEVNTHTSDFAALFWSQIAYLENLLKVYNEEIFRLQKAELSLHDLEAEDSLYIQEHQLKRKVRLGFTVTWLRD